MSRRPVLKERKHPFNLQEELTINRREILKYLRILKKALSAKSGLWME